MIFTVKLYAKKVWKGMLLSFLTKLEWAILFQKYFKWILCHRICYKTHYVVWDMVKKKKKVFIVIIFHWVDISNGYFNCKISNKKSTTWKDIKAYKQHISILLKQISSLPIDLRLTYRHLVSPSRFPPESTWGWRRSSWWSPRGRLSPLPHWTLGFEFWLSHCPSSPSLSSTCLHFPVGLVGRHP